MIGLSSLALAVLSTMVIMILLVISIFLIPFILMVLIISSTFLLIGTLITNTEESFLKLFLSRESEPRKHLRAVADMIPKPLNLLYAFKDPGRKLAQPLSMSVANMILDDGFHSPSGYQVIPKTDPPVQNDSEFINNGETVEISRYVDDVDGEFSNSSFGSQ